MADLRLLTVTHWGFDGRAHTGQLVVNRDVAAPLAKVFRRLYRLRFPIRHMELGDLYGPRRARPVDGDVTGSFHCRRAVPSPCGSGSGNWSNHAYGHAVDLNPKENPYVGCGAVYDPRSRPYVDRTPLRKGMRHRLVLSYQALAEEVSPDSILDRVVAAVPAPQLDLQHVTAA